MGKRDRHPRKYGIWALAILPVAAVALAALWASHALSPAVNRPGSAQVSRDPTELLKNGVALLDAGKIQAAMIQLKEAVRLTPTDGEARAQLGVALLRSGKAIEAENELRRAIDPAQSDNRPNELVVPHLLRAMLARKGYDEVVTEFPDPAPNTPNDLAAEILGARATAFQLSGHREESRKAMDRSLGLRRDAAGLVQSARLARQQGDLGLAFKQLDEAIELSSEPAFVYSILFIRETGDTQKALAKAEEFVQRFPRSFNAKSMRIDLLLELRENERAKKEVDALLAQAPNSPMGRFYRAVVMMREKDFNGAWVELRRFQPEFFQSQAPITLLAASIAISSGHAEFANAMLTTFVARNPDNRIVRLQLAATQLSLAAPRLAADTLIPIQTANDAALHGLLAQSYLGLEQLDDALASLEIVSWPPKANNLLKPRFSLPPSQMEQGAQAIINLRDLLERDPSNAAAAAPLISALIATSQWDEALRLTGKMANQAPNNRYPAFYQGQVHLARGSFVDAETAFTKALTIDPSFAPAIYFRAIASAARGDRNAARKDLQLVLERDPSVTHANIRLAEIALSEGKDAEALALFDGAIKTAPRALAPRLALANYHTAHGRYQEAQATVTGLLQISPSDPEGQALLAHIRQQLGQRTGALRR